MNKTTLIAESFTNCRDEIEVPSWAKANRWASMLIRRRLVKRIVIVSKNQRRVYECTLPK